MPKVSYVSILALPLMMGAQFSGAEPTGMHLYEAAKADPALAVEFRRAMKPIAPNSAWVESFGTTSPSIAEDMDGKTYDVYWGCKPHDCITENYVVMYSRSARQITAGAFVRNMYDGPNLTESRITWLGRTDFDAARTLGKYLY